MSQAEAIETIKKRIMDNKWAPYVSIYQSALSGQGQNAIATLAIFYLESVEKFGLFTFKEIDGEIVGDILVLWIGTRSQCHQELAWLIKEEANKLS